MADTNKMQIVLSRGKVNIVTVTSGLMNVTSW